MTRLHDIVKTMDPSAALTALSDEVRYLLAQLDEDSGVNFITNLIGEPGEDKISSLVHL